MCLVIPTSLLTAASGSRGVFGLVPNDLGDLPAAYLVPATTDGPGHGIPVAWAAPVATDSGPRLRVLRCPFCQGMHHHSAGYAIRVSHCHSGDYALCSPDLIHATTGQEQTNHDHRPEN